MKSKHQHRTEDNHWVDSTTAVWEIMWRYLNPEVSLAEPEERPAGFVPRMNKIWKDRGVCKRVCNRLNNHRQ